MKTIRYGKKLGRWPFALLVGTGALIVGCSRVRREPPEQSDETLPNAPQVAPPIEQQDAERQRDEAAQRVVSAEEVGSRPVRRHAHRAPGEDRTDKTDRADLEGFEGHIGFEPGTALRALQGRSLRSGAALIEGSEIRIRTGDTGLKPTVSGGPPQPYQFTIDMHTPDEKRRGHGLSMDVGDRPYLTMPPINPDVSESTVRPFD